MPVAQDWSGSAPKPEQGSANPHAGMNMGGSGDPHAGLNMGGSGDPHAGLDMGSDPHAGLDMGDGGMAMGNGNPGGLEAPDPNRAIDPKMFLKGKITVSKEAKALVKPGAILFLSARPVNKATGESMGAPLAVDRIDVQGLPLDFHLSGAQTMVAGTKFEGDVMLYARVDGDGEASSKRPGDVEGSVLVTIPAEGIDLVLNQVIK